ncbi:The fantastic four family [Heracleum sosnowskyi]|uniref:The fantastic four family n=1 Tax=Heracleum sosnowskyi TaxID=360622 RepID=A0AAD8HUI2_9APIA|nr:The fantastic four family [Heracleum sosnowskyi]
MLMISKPFRKNQDKDHSRNENNKNGYNDKGGWNFIEALINPSHITKEVTDKNEQVYVHPFVKRSSSALSSKGLEMCTESLGCETGSDTSSDAISSFSWEKEKMQFLTDEYVSLYSNKLQQLKEFSSPWFHKNRSSYRKFTRLNTSQSNFPPPLTSISGSDGVAVRPRREGGRLIINAVAVSSCQTYLKADRRNGRLRLCLRTECSVDCDCEMNKKAEVVYDKEDEQVVELGNVSKLADNEDDEDCSEEDMEGNNRKVRLSMCKEGGRGGKEMSNWGGLPFLEISVFNLPG